MMMRESNNNNNSDNDEDLEEIPDQDNLWQRRSPRLRLDVESAGIDSCAVCARKTILRSYE